MTNYSTQSGADVRGDLFVNRRFEWEQFVMVPHTWIRDTRIRGNALSLLLAIRMHADGFLMTTEGLKRQLDLGKDAFMRARKALVDAGYLIHEVRRYEGPTEGHAAVPGMRRGQVLGSRYEVRDPWSEGDGVRARPGRPRPKTSYDVSIEKSWSTAGGGKADVDEPEAGDQVAAFPPLNKNKINKKTFNKTKDHHPAAPRLEGQSGVDMRDVDPRLRPAKLSSMLERLGVWSGLHRLDEAAAEVLSRVRGPVNDPNAYVARAIAADQDSWRKIHPSTGRPLISCDLNGHRPVSDGLDTYCEICGSELDEHAGGENP